MDYKKQVDSSHYEFLKYVTKERFMSYYYQLRYINKIKPKKILEIGPGGEFIKNQCASSKVYKTLDIAEDTGASIIASVENMPLKDNSFDFVLCCQVLEHIPFEKFDFCLKEIQRVTKKHALIGLPYSNRNYYFELKMPFSKKIRLSITFPNFFTKHKFDGQHYWEIGKKGYPINRIKNILIKYFSIEEILNPSENKYHIFFLLKKR